MVFLPQMMNSAYAALSAGVRNNYPMITGTRIGTNMLKIAPDMKEYTAISLLVAFSTMGRHTSMAAEPGSPTVSTYPIFLATTE